METPTPFPYEQLISPVKSGNVFEETVEKIMALINSGVVLPGKKLPSERELTDLLGVSRSAVHEAIAALQKTGHIEVKRGRYGGAFVQQLDLQKRPEKYFEIDELEDLLRYREILESAIAQEAARQTLTAEQRAGLLEKLAEAARAPEHLFRYYDSRFHLYLAQLTGLTMLVQDVLKIRTAINECLDAFPLIGANLTHSHQQHAAIVDAIMAGDASAAEAGMREHVRGTASLIRGFLTAGPEAAKGL